VVALAPFTSKFYHHTICGIAYLTFDLMIFVCCPFEKVGYHPGHSLLSNLVHPIPPHAWDQGVVALPLPPSRRTRFHAPLLPALHARITRIPFW